MRTLTMIQTVCGSLLLASLTGAAAPVMAGDVLGYARTVDIAARAMCDMPIVMLGENSHGDGNTTSFKVALVKKLINECDFNAVYFEAGIYDFLDIENRLRSGKAITPEMVSSSMGWIRNQNKEIAPLIPFLYNAAVDGRVILGGLDDQLGGRGAYYSNDQMLQDMSNQLTKDKQQICYDRFKQWVWGDFPEDAPYTTEGRSRIEQCLTDTEAAINYEESDRPSYDQSFLAMVASFRRVLARGFTDPKTYAPRRDHSMFLNFEWLRSRLSANSNIIIWSVNSHVAKDPSTAQAFLHGRNLGSYIAENYGDQAFALGFSAAGGSYRWSGNVNKPVPVAADRSLEARAIEGIATPAAYVNHAQLSEFGVVDAASFGHKISSYDWSKVFDGVIVFRQEQPLTPIAKK